MMQKIVRNCFNYAAGLMALQFFTFQLLAEQPMAKEIASIEGITEYRLGNGVQVLLFPDESKSQVTVNMTVFVGSRHEGYGEAGMAHLLEHMLFKGTPSHAKIPEELKNRGADFNGTTWLDRTNYYETLPAATDQQAQESLEFAISLEADRLMNSYVKGEDLTSEMTVVRNEFERGENNPQRVLMQRVQAVAYEWHNYGRSTIGNRSDIERVPIDRLQAFYRKFYRPDNVMLVISGKFDPTHCLKLVETYFGALSAPETPLDRTYTTEPPQDGERSVVLRRVGTTQLLTAAYHVPSGAHREFAAVELLGYVFGTEPSGRLYRSLVVPELATNSTSYAMALHDPGIIMFGAQVPKDKSLEKAQEALLKAVEEVGQVPITEEELKRAKTQFLKDRELRASDSKEIAIELSEWAAEGDWRLYFLFRDHIEATTAQECTAAAVKYFTRNNRTLGTFIPTEKSERIEVPSRPDLAPLLADYKGRGDLQRGEQFDPAPMAVEKRITRGKLSTGIKTAWLPKKTRGEMVNISLNLRYGNEQALLPFVTAAEFLPDLLLRGTKKLTYEQLQDRLDDLRARVDISTGGNGLLSVSIETKREYLEELLPLVAEILREPRFDADELEVLRRQAITATESRITEPQTLAGLAVNRALAPFDKQNIRYVPTLEERIERYKAVTIEQVKQLHSTLLNGQYGEVTAVGDFDPASVQRAFESMLSGWTSTVPQERVAQPAITNIAAVVQKIETPDKANAVFYGGEQIAMRDDHPDYPALVIGNYILGAGALSSRLGDRIRQKEGLSYGVGSGLSAHPIDERTRLTLFAITNPENRKKLMDAMNEEIAKLLAAGITENELADAKQGFLQSEQLARTNDAELCNAIAGTIFANRDMSYHYQFEKAIADLTVAKVNAALKKYIDPSRLVIAVAGDFAKAEPEAEASK
jgi:zinc protease